MDISEFSKRIRNRNKNQDNSDDDGDERSIQGGFFLRWHRGSKPPNWREIIEILVAALTAIGFAIGMGLMYRWLSKWLEMQ